MPWRSSGRSSGPEWAATSAASGGPTYHTTFTCAEDGLDDGSDNDVTTNQSVVAVYGQASRDYLACYFTNWNNNNWNGFGTYCGWNNLWFRHKTLVENPNNTADVYCWDARPV